MTIERLKTSSTKSISDLSQSFSLSHSLSLSLSLLHFIFVECLIFIVDAEPYLKFCLLIFDCLLHLFYLSASKLLIMRSIVSHITFILYLMILAIICLLSFDSHQTWSFTARPYLTISDSERVCVEHSSVCVHWMTNRISFSCFV
jgi:hypothetical protein